MSAPKQMGKLKLSVAQLEMLRAAAEPNGAGAASFYPPAKKLLALALVEQRQIKYGSRYFATDAGRAAMEANNG